MERVYTFFIHMRATREWLSLSRDQRNHFRDTVLNPIFARYPSVKVRFFDVEAFTAKCSDIAMFETTDIRQYYFVIDAIRDSKVFTEPYFEFLDIFPAVENGFEDYERELKKD